MTFDNISEDFSMYWLIRRLSSKQGLTNWPSVNQVLVNPIASDAAHENDSFFQVFNELVFARKRNEVTLLPDSEHGFIHLQVGCWTDNFFMSLILMTTRRKPQKATRHGKSPLLWLIYFQRLLKLGIRW